MLRVDLRHARIWASFEAPAGVTALFGPSGAGKTSLALAIAGLLRPDAGRIEAAGAVLYDSARGIDVPVHRRRIGYVFQEGRLFPHLSVRRNLLYGARGRSGLEGVVAMLGIGDLLARRPASLSGGEKQRVAIGRALLSEPRLLIMDEPLASLDAARKAEILPWLERLRDEAGVPVLYVSHSAAEIARLARTVVHLSAGRVVSVDRAPEAGTARVIAHEGADRTIVTVDGVRVSVPRLDVPPGTRVVLGAAPCPDENGPPG